MERNGPGGRVTSTAALAAISGTLDAALHARLRAGVGEHRTGDVDPDEHALLVADLVAAGRAGLTPAAVNR